ncbi:MAG: TIGR01777 family oxidoreductase [Crocinitomicaceae bacterium]
MAKIIIAGGSGLIGKALEKILTENHHDVFIFTRTPKKSNHISWDPANGQLDSSKINGTEILINLCGENVGAQRWTNVRKQVLSSSRIGTTQLLHQHFQNVSTLQQYLSASGINCYPLESTKKMQENDAYGSDYLSQLVKEWEFAADLFETQVPVCKLRISMVLDKNDGALQKLLPLVKLGLASPLGSGNQWMSWVHIDDVVGAFVFAIDQKLNGAFNLTGKQVSNTEFTRELMQSNGKTMRFPKIPAFVMKLVLGEQATIVLDGTHNDNSLLKEKGFHYQFEELSVALKTLFGK